jgi:hypothetical protein
MHTSTTQDAPNTPATADAPVVKRHSPPSNAQVTHDHLRGLRLPGVWRITPVGEAHYRASRYDSTGSFGTKRLVESRFLSVRDGVVTVRADTENKSYRIARLSK